MDHLSPLDASFLDIEDEDPHVSLAIASLAVADGPPPGQTEFVEAIRGRLPLVPRYRQKLAIPPVETGRPFWVDDPQFNLGYHVRHSALPAPGDENVLRRMAARVFSQQLDRTKPLWELWLVEGLRKRRFALISKTHHALVDGVAGVDIATVLFDVKPVPEPAKPDREWIPSPSPSAATLAAHGIEGVAKAPIGVARRVASAVASPGAAARQIHAAA